MRRISKDTRRVVVDQTEMQKRRFEKFMDKARRIANDEDRAQRLTACLCIGCCYIPPQRLAGQAFTDWSCIQCERPQPRHPNTNVPQLCIACGTKYHLCSVCLADLDLSLDDDRNMPLVKTKKAPI